MSQAGTLNRASGPLPPSVPLQFTTDSGVAVPVANNLNIFGDHGINTAGAGDTVTVAINNTITLGDLVDVGSSTDALTLASGRITTDNGSVRIGSTSTSPTGANSLAFIRSRNGAAVNSGDLLGQISFGGVPLVAGSVIQPLIRSFAGTPGAAFIPMDLEFGTVNSTGVLNTRATISEAGNVTINAPDSGDALTAIAGDVVLDAGNLRLPTTSSTVGQIQINGVRYFHGFGVNNVFAGPGAGNFTATGIQNSGYGLDVLSNLSSGNQNVAVGASAMSLGTVSGFGNVACGVGALAALTSGISNTCTGGLSGVGIDVGASNSCYGASSGGSLTSGVENCFYGAGSGAATGANVQQNCGYGNTSLGVTSGNRNCAFGHSAMSQNVSGDNNCAFGPDAYANNSATGEYNVCIGVEAGTNYTGSESSNIIIGNNLGVLGDNNTIRIGAPGSSTGQQDTCYIAGISGSTVAGSALPVFVDITGQLGTSGGSFGTTNHAVQVGNASGTLTSIAVGATGQLLVGATGADPAFASSATGDFTFTSSTAGATRTFTVSNTDNTNASSTALIVASTGGASAGDAVYRASTTATNWSWGVDNSASDAFVVAQGTALGTNNVMSVATAGQINYPLQPGFFAYNSATVSNVTGDGTDYTIIFDTELYDVGSNYNNATGTFTAPVTGKYLFTMVLSLTNISATHTSGICFIATSTNQYRMFAVNPNAVAITGGNLSFSGSVIVPLTAGQVANCHITVGTTGKTVGVFGNANGNTSFAGQLLA